MAHVSPRSGMRRRTISEINMVPFIDVMLVLLIIFMVTAPLITTGLVDLPSVGKAKQRPEHVIELIVGSDESVRLRLDGKDPQSVPLKGGAARRRAAPQGRAGAAGGHAATCRQAGAGARCADRDRTRQARREAAQAEGAGRGRGRKTPGREEEGARGREEAQGRRGAPRGP